MNVLAFLSRLKNAGGGHGQCVVTKSHKQVACADLLLEIQAVRLQMSSISSDADGLDSSRTSRSSSQGLDSVRQGSEPSARSRQRGNRSTKGATSMWREPGKAMFRSVSGAKPS